MKVRDFCRTEVVTARRGASLREASILMRNHHVGALVVTEGEGREARPVGILTDRDIIVAVIAVPGARPEGIRVGDAMSKRVACAREDDGIFEAARAMAERGVRRLPVISADGALRGMVTLDDVLGVLSRELANLTAALKGAGEREALERRILDVLAAPA